jgi:hypothetical protein
MDTKSASIVVDANLAEAYNAAPESRRKKALSAMRQALRAAPENKKKAMRLSPSESRLFLKINSNLSDERQQRYDELTEKRLAGKLSARESAELSELIKEIEQIWNGRLRAVIELARRRKVSPEKMMKQLELDPRVKAS